MAHDAATGYLNINGNAESDGSGSSSEYSSEYDGVDNMNNAGGGYNNGGDVDNNNGGNNFNGNTGWNSITMKLLSLYGKTQVGTVYDQLNDGARALDLRPKIYSNGTVGFHHGSLIVIPLKSITLGGLLDDAKQWCQDNPKELVIIFHSELVHEAGYNGLSSKVYLEADDDYGDGDDYEYNQAQQEEEAYDDAVNYAAEDADDDNPYYGGGDDANNNANNANDDDGQQQEYEYYYSGIAKMREVYQDADVPYYPCSKLAGLTVGEAMQLADLSKTGGKGYLLAVDRHDMYGEWITLQMAFLDIVG